MEKVVKTSMNTVIGMESDRSALPVFFLRSSVEELCRSRSTVTPPTFL